MPAATFYQPIEKIIDGKCEYSYYSSSNDKYSKDAPSRICHIVLPNANEENSDVLMLIFTIRNQNGKWKIHSEGAQRMDQGAMVPTRNTAIRVAKKNRWKFIAIATAGKDTPEDDIVSEYFISIESYSYGNDTVYEITNELSKLDELGRPDFYRTYIKLGGAIYSLAFIKREKLMEYLYTFDDRPYGNLPTIDDATAWHKNDPTEEEYANFKLLLSFFVQQLRINNDWTPGEKKFVDSGKPNSTAFIEDWRHFNGFEVSCRFGKGYNVKQSGANYLNYSWVNINPNFDLPNSAVASVTVRTKPEKELVFEGTSFAIDSLDLESDSLPNDALKALFIEFREEIFKWQKGVYSKGSEKSHSLNYNTEFEAGWPRNRILFGAPGTGKSFSLEKERKDLLYGDPNADEGTLNLSEYGSYERVTFHPDYSYASFVGTYKPVSSFGENNKKMITYEFVPGPFMRVYANALENGCSDEVKPYLLIIEEINRANVAAVFGDVFQLLDRNSKGVSEYPIEASEDMKNYLAERLKRDPEEFTTIRIPNNMYIWATMNSADQGVFPMDTAFKRRWDFTYIGIDEKESELGSKTVILGKGENQRKVEWNKLRKAINAKLSEFKINEDKQLGPFFLSKEIVAPDGKEIDPNAFIRTFKNKVLMYLFEDAAKQKRQSLFEGCLKDKSRYSEICTDFDERGIMVFCQEIVNNAEAQHVTETTTAQEEANE